MAVDRERVKARFKEKFKTVTLSNQRIDEISDRLAPQIADDAEDAVIDSQLDFLNGMHPKGTFLVMQKADDAEANERFNKQKPKTQNQNPDSNNQQQNTPPQDQNQDQSELSKLIAAAVSQAVGPLAQKITAMESEKQQVSKRQKAISLVPDITEDLLDLLLPSMPESEEEVSGWADKAKNAVTGSLQKLTNASVGTGATARGTTTANTPAGKVSPAMQRQIERENQTKTV